MQSIRQVAHLNDLELEKVVPPNGSWHADYRDTAYIYIGGLPFELSEGDILTIFSQYGNPVHVNLVRDKDTGKSRGFCFLKYEDQRSCDLAVDNLSGAGVMGRVVSVDHTRYKRKEGEVETIGENEGGDETEREGEERRKRRRTESQTESEEERPLIKGEVELAKLKREMDDDDPMKGYLATEKQAEVEEALKAVVRRKEKEKDRKYRHRRRHGSKRNGEDERSTTRRRPRRERSDDEDEDRRDRKRQSYKSRRERSVTPDSEDERSRRKTRSRRDDSESRDEEPRRSKDKGHRSRRRDESDSERSRSRETHRRR